LSRCNRCRLEILSGTLVAILQQKNTALFRSLICYPVELPGGHRYNYLLVKVQERRISWQQRRNRVLEMALKSDRLPTVITTSLALVLLFFIAEVNAGTLYQDAKLVEFESVPFTYTPSPFRVRQAKKLGIQVEVRTQARVSVIGYLAKPADDKRRAAVVLLHTCAGITEHEEMWSNRLVSWGFVVLTVDSFTPRGYKYICDGRTGELTTPWLRALDAYGAKQYLSSQPFVDPDRIAVMGMSHGGTSVLETIKQSSSDGLRMGPFQAAIAYYPLCGAVAAINTPTLILIGEKDSWTHAYLCEEYVGKLAVQHDIHVKVFADSHHAFDHPGIDMIDAGHVVRSNPDAATRAAKMVNEFLHKYL
jgi:dienelactone hydrolase